MILETAEVKIAAEHLDKFEKAMTLAVETVLSQANGFIKFELHKGIEKEDTYLFHIHWDSLESHTIGFRESDLFIKWRELIGPYFSHPPEINHWSIK
jgi:quinol monooxygenase YgiN